MSAAAPQLPGIFHTLAPVLDHYGYLAVGGFLFLEDFGVPVPGETILIAAAVYAGAGRLNIVAVAALALVAAVLGDNLGFAIGHFGGRRLVLRWGKYVFITAERLNKAEDWFHRHGGKVVTVARFIEGLRQANGIVAGVTRMHWLRFLAFNVLGAALWVAVWTTVGYVSGSHLNTIYGTLRQVFLYLVGAFLLFLVVRFLLHRRRQRAAAAPGAGVGADGDRRAPEEGGSTATRELPGAGGARVADGRGPSDGRHGAEGGSRAFGAKGRTIDSDGP